MKYAPPARHSAEKAPRIRTRVLNVALAGILALSMAPLPAFADEPDIDDRTVEAQLAQGEAPASTEAQPAQTDSSTIAELQLTRATAADAGELQMVRTDTASTEAPTARTDTADAIGQAEAYEAPESAMSERADARKLYAAVPGGLSILSVTPPSTVTVTGTSSLQAYTNVEYVFTVNDHVAVAESSDTGYTYRVVPIAVSGNGVSYTYAHADEQDDYPTSFTPSAADASKQYTITYRAQYLDTDDNTWHDANASDFTVTLSVQGETTFDRIVGDEVRVSSLSFTVVNDGTPVWDDNDAPGNDSGANNGRVRTFDNIDYFISFATESKTASHAYKYGRVYFEATLPVSKDKATFDVDGMSAYIQDYELVESAGSQTLKFYYEQKETTDASGKTTHAMPSLAQFPFHVKVLAAGNGDDIQPTITASVEYYDDESYATTKTSGAYDQPQTAMAGNVKVSAAPNYNVQLTRGASYTANVVANFDFTTGNDKALDKSAGSDVYGRLLSFGITLQLYNTTAAKGLKGIEYPKGPITFDIDLSQVFKTSSTQYSVQAPLVWSAGPNLSTGDKQDTRDIASYSDVMYTTAPINKYTGTLTVSPSTGALECWNGGDWSFAREEDTLHVTVSDYEINKDWFPNANAGSGRGSNVYFSPAEGVQNIGCFSAGQLFLVFPFGGDGKQSDDYYPNKYGEAGSLQAVIQDKNLKVTSVSGQKAETVHSDTQGQVYYPDDDKLDLSVLLATPGTYSPRISYSRYSSGGNYDVDGLTAHQNDGGDVSALGNTISISWALDAKVQDLNDSLYAYNNLMLFDDEAFEPTGRCKRTYRATEDNTALLYAAKPDKTGWASDEEMKTAKEEDLVYFSSLSQLESAGYVCVGLLAETREDLSTNVPGGRLQAYLQAEVKIKSDASIAGKVYMVSSAHRVWDKAGVEAVMAAHGGTFPSRLNMSVGQTIETLDAATKPVYDTTDSANRKNYEKATYGVSGFQPGSGTEPNWGDSLYIQPYKMEVQKYVLQKDGLSGQTVNMQLAHGESIVDYQIRPKFNTGGVTFENFATTVTLTDTLPAGLAYKPNSSYLGGTYTQNADAGKQGSVSGGVPLEPASITSNADGTTTLVWEIEDVGVGSDIPYVYFSADIDQSIEQQTTFVNKVFVNSTEDTREPDASKNNLDTATIAVAPSSSVVVKKEADQLFHNRNDDLGYTLRWTNTGGGAFDGLVMMESFPHDGDDFGTRLKNPDAYYDLHEDLVFTFPSGKTASDYRIYYTTDEAAYGKRAFDLQDHYSDFAGETCTVDSMSWTHVGIDGTRVHTHDNTNITAFVILGSLGGKESIEVSLKLRPHNFAPGDVVVNCISANNITSTSTIYIVDRVLRGTVWIDADVNGQRDAGEERVPGVKVVLKDSAGASVGETATDAQGNYEFAGLLAGTYTVEFTNNGKVLKTYRATVQNASGVPESVNSDATAKYGDEVFADIGGISMPDAADITSSPYVVRYQDLGIYRPDLTVAKEVDARSAADPDAELAKSFLFKLKLADCPADETYAILDKDGASAGTVTGAQLASGYEFSLAHDEAYTFKGLPVGLDYTVEEYDYATYGYKTKVGLTGDAASGSLDSSKTVNYKNTFDPEFVERAVEKEWSEDATAGISEYERPENVTVDLYANGTKAESKTVRGDTWKESFTGLPKYPYETAAWPASFTAPALTPIDYTVQESKVGDSEATLVGGEKRFYVYSDSVSVGDLGEEFAILGYFASSDPVLDTTTNTFKVVNTFVPATEEELGTSGFSILKVDDKGKAITSSSARFKLVKVQDEGEETEVGTVETSTADGKARFDGLSAGTYVLTEEAAPEGYEKSDVSYTITMEEEGASFARVDKENNKNIFEMRFRYTVSTPDGPASWDGDTLTLTVQNVPSAPEPGPDPDPDPEPGPDPDPKSDPRSNKGSVKPAAGKAGTIAAMGDSLGVLGIVSLLAASGALLAVARFRRRRN